MKFSKMCMFLMLVTTLFALGACGNDDDDDDGGGFSCVSYCAEMDSIDCLDDSSVSSCEASCDMMSEDEDCGAEYMDLIECEYNSGMECVDGWVETEGCGDESDAYFDCVFPT